MFKVSQSSLIFDKDFGMCKYGMIEYRIHVVVCCIVETRYIHTLCNTYQTTHISTLL